MFSLHGPSRDGLKKLFFEKSGSVTMRLTGLSFRQSRPFSEFSQQHVKIAPSVPDFFRQLDNNRYELINPLSQRNGSVNFLILIGTVTLPIVHRLRVALMVLYAIK
ncbi:hypothetical protein M0M42_13025 [Pseudomonas knackmussii]|uniref:Uncharacterized protein n=1 Tax=Pseudomonas knackmussii TaxID=65741 RepID=A0ABY4KKI8_9PSED|nr:hypothetical protein [Pseudomonas knackmussii]UPQ81347.1 hypothetical protein M0M42_13025 [Pseudomonas knackmussii]